jgi:sulfur carrier protein
LRITLNGREEILKDGTTLTELVSLKQLNIDDVIVVYNHQLAKKESWPDIVLKENDGLEFLRFVGGG